MQLGEKTVEMAATRSVQFRLFGPLQRAARLRGAPPDVPFLLDAKRLEAGGNFTFETRLGSLDCLADVGGIQSYLTNYGAPYGDLPGGLVSANSTNNGGSGEVSVEVWWKNTGGTTPGTTGNGPWSWSRVFDTASAHRDRSCSRKSCFTSGLPNGLVR